MKKGHSQIINYENFSYLSQVFFKKQTREETLATQALDSTLKKIKRLQNYSVAPSQTDKIAAQNIQNQVLNQCFMSEHLEVNQNGQQVQPLNENISSTSHCLSKDTIQENKNEMQEDEKEQEQKENAQEVPGLDLIQLEFFCEICQKQYKNKKTYNSHVQTRHNETKPFLCSFCQKSFKRPDYLQKHIESHQEDKEISCNECDKKFKSKHTHEKHVKTVHKKIICGTCKCCNKGFTRMDYLKKHLQRGQQNYKCVYQEYGKKFSSKQSMERHNTIQHQG